MQGRQVGSWIIERKIDEGGMGKVYFARHKFLKTQAAVKVLATELVNDPTFRERFFREARIQAELIHPHIAQVLDYIEQDSQFYLVIEYLAGGTLAEVIKKSPGAIAQARALSWVKQALSALDYAHQQRVIHRDIKPSNLMLDRQGNIKVVDFGIAIDLDGKRVTRTGVSLGTPYYMSPEQIVRPKELDHRTDVYSIGTVLYELLAGRLPFFDENNLSIREAQIRRMPPPLRSINPKLAVELERIVMKALAKDRNSRYSGCGEFAREIEAFEKGEDGKKPEKKKPRTPTTIELPPQQRQTIKDPSHVKELKPNPYPPLPALPVRQQPNSKPKKRLTAAVVGIGLTIIAAVALYAIFSYWKSDARGSRGIKITLFDRIGDNQLSEQVVVLIDGKNVGTFSVNNRDKKTEHLEIDLPKEGKYSYTAQAQGIFVDDDGDQFPQIGTGQGMIDASDGEQFHLAGTYTGSTWFITIIEGDGRQ